MKGNAIFVTGTDTNVGKTLVSAILTLGTNGRYWKPIQTGSDIDREWIQNTTQLPREHFFNENYSLSKPLSPHAAAEIDGVTIHRNNIHAPPLADGQLLVVEGAGGLLVPINRHDFIVDVIKDLQLPVLLVARSGLGTINHTLLSLRLLKEFKIALLGIVLNGERNRSNRNAVEYFGRVEVVAELEPLAILNKQTLQETYDLKFRKFVEDFLNR
jgi:dethiobiotin synthetase